MKSKSRLESGFINMFFSSFMYILCTLFQFVGRTIFIKILSAEYLGLNGLFSNILNFLSLAEMGVGVAIGYALYRPLSENNINTIKTLMWLYKKIYFKIGIFVLIIGICIAPFLEFFINDAPQDVGNIKLYYILYVINSSVSYFYTYKRTILISDQKQYISVITQNLSKILLNIAQVIILVITKSFTLYLVVMVIFTVSENIFISKISDRFYPYLNDKTNIEKLDYELEKQIKKNIGAIIFHKIGSVIVFSTNNLIISKFVGLVAVGLYSNYMMIVNSVNTLLSQLFGALTASVGNYFVEKNKDDIEKMFNNIFYLNYIVYSISSICLFTLIKPFIILWLGEGYLLSNVILVTIVINFYLNGVRKAIGIFKDASGIFWQDRYKPIIESIINITVSIPLAFKYGIVGVMIGNIISTITIPIWFEAYVVYKCSFSKSMKPYVFKQIEYFFKTIFVAYATFLIIDKIYLKGFIGLIVMSTLVVIISSVFTIILNLKNNENKYIIGILKNLFNKFFKLKI